MNTYTPAQYNDILFKKLPQEVRDVVMNSDTTKALWAIGEKHKLHIDKIGMMHDLAMDVMMGITASKNFVKELTNELGISPFDASSLARDIDEEIFKPIKTTMIKLYGDGAPYKPSSSLVQFYEEDDEHPNLDKDLLLKEIENPTEVKPRVERVVVKNDALLPLEKAGMGLETMDEVKELKEMQKEFTPPKPPQNGGLAAEAPSPLERAGGEAVSSAAISSSLDRIASLKLSKTFVMPKSEEDISSSFTLDKGKVGMGSDFNPSSDISPLKKVEEKMPTPSITPKAPNPSPAPKSYSADPYREPIN